MQILSSRLVRLIDDDVPLPWYHRAPLGLITGATLHLGLQEPQGRPVGDLLVSLVDPINWPYLTTVTTSRRDAPGVLASAFESAPPLNIVFAEAVTVDSGARHEVTLMCEPFGLQPDDGSVDERVQQDIQNMLDALADEGFDEPTKSRAHREAAALLWSQRVVLRNGWAPATGWTAAIEEHYDELQRNSVDLSVAVVSADTRQRLMRFVFPRHGARSVKVRHADRPGAMRVIASRLAAQDLNILSLLNRRGSMPGGMAEIVAIVEPLPDAASQDTEEMVEAARKAAPVELETHWSTQGAADPSTLIYPHRPGDIVARPPASLRPLIRETSKHLAKDTIFISRRFAPAVDPMDILILETIHRLVAEAGFQPLEAEPEPGSTRVSSEDVKAKMWLATAAIMLIVATGDEQELSVNLAHEAGFMQGQGKELLPLVQHGLESAVISYPNLQGLQLTTFSRDRALVSHDAQSIEQKLLPWLESLKASSMSTIVA